MLALFVLANHAAFSQWRQPASIFGDEQWDNRFLPPGLSNGDSPIATNGIGALAAKGSEVYVGGAFTTAGGVPANNIARWDGRRWSALGSGVSGGTPARVWTIAFHGSDIYVGGIFSSAGGIAANNIAKWDGTQWSALGNGLGGVVNDIAIGPNGEVYAAGSIPDLGHIAKWDGNAWSALGSGVSGSAFPGVSTFILDVAVKGNEVYVCGAFASAGGVQANQIAKWTGSQWAALGGGITQTNGEWISSIEIFGNNLVAGGLFYSIGNVKTNCIAMWDGTRWSPMGPANNDGLTGFAGDGFWGAWGLAVVGNALYAAGGFESAGGQPANNLALWNGSAWSGMQSGNARANQYFAAVAVSGSAAYVASAGLLAIGEVVTNSIAKFENGVWSALGSGFDATVQDIVASANGEVYVGGHFSAVGDVSANRIVKWNGATWSALGSGLDGPVRALAVRGSEVFAGGSFKNAGGVAANSIAKWDGQSWSALGGGVAGGNAQVNAIAIKGNDVYIGGSFTTAGGAAASNVAKWGGVSWSALGSGIEGSVNGIAVAGNGEVYAGGIFDNAGGVNAKGIAKWNGTSWSALGSGITGALQWVYAVVGNGDDIYVGGRFTAAGGISSNHIAKWNSITSAWSAIGTGVGDPASVVYAFAVNGNAVYAGGSFATTGALAANNIAKWDGNQWSTLGSGIGGSNPVVLALAVAGGEVYAGGDFTIAGKKPSFKFARWSGNTTGVVAEKIAPRHFALQQNYPNPFWSAAASRFAGNPSTTIRYVLPQTGLVTLKIYNMSGQELATLVNQLQGAGEHTISWNAESLSSGVYVYRLQIGEFSETKKMILFR
jgi:hypothetical protein